VAPLNIFQKLPFCNWGCGWPPLVASLVMVVWGVSDLETIKKIMVAEWVANLNAPGKLH